MKSHDASGQIKSDRSAKVEPWLAVWPSRAEVSLAGTLIVYVRAIVVRAQVGASAGSFEEDPAEGTLPLNYFPPINRKQFKLSEIMIKSIYDGY